MAKKAAKKKMGRPMLEFDLVELDKLASLGATYDDLADWYETTRRTIDRRIAKDDDFCRAFKKGQAKLKMSIRRNQVKLANDGNVTMNIWLGKQLLGQTDKMNTKSEVSIADTAPVIHLTAKKPDGK